MIYQKKRSQEEREAAEHLAKVIILVCDRKPFEYEDEATSDFYYKQYSNDNDENEGAEAESRESESGSEYEVEDDLKKKHHEIPNFPLDFIRCVVDYAYTENELGRCRRTWKSVKHRLQTLRNQNYVSRS